MIKTLLLFVSIMGGCAYVESPLATVDPISFRPGPFRLERRLAEIDTLRVGSYPKSVTLNPAHTRAYVCDLEQGAVDVFRAADGKKLSRLAFDRTPVQAVTDGETIDSFEEKPVETAFTKQGRLVWISLLNAAGVVVYDTQGKNRASNGAVKIARERHAVGKTRTLNLRFISTGAQPKVIAVSPGEKFVFVANWKGRSVTVIDAASYQPLKTIRTGWLPRGICFSRTRAYVANFGSDSISVINLKTLTIERTWNDVGRNPRHLAASRDGKSIYMSTHGDDRIRKLDMETGAVQAECAVGNEPRTLAVSTNDLFLFVVNYKDDTVSVIDTRSMTPVLTVPTLRRPIGVSVDSASNTVWVSGYWDRAVRRYKFESELKKIF